jgi:hypothetical protein
MLDTLRKRFEDNPSRHGDVSWQEVEDALLRHPDALRSIAAMEKTGGEPDVIGRDEATGALLVCDCSRESPAGRRSLCYDDVALRKRKRNPPKGSALAQAEQMGVDLLSEEEYGRLQTLGAFDLKTSSWIATPPELRELGGALFCERRYERVFVFHNGADSYYASRGWRGILRLPA